MDLPSKLIDLIDLHAASMSMDEYSSISKFSKQLPNANPIIYLPEHQERDLQYQKHILYLIPGNQVTGIYSNDEFARAVYVKLVGKELQVSSALLHEDRLSYVATSNQSSESGKMHESEPIHMVLEDRHFVSFKEHVIPMKNENLLQMISDISLEKVYLQKFVKVLNSLTDELPYADANIIANQIMKSTPYFLSSASVLNSHASDYLESVDYNNNIEKIIADRASSVQTIVLNGDLLHLEDEIITIIRENTVKQLPFSVDELNTLFDSAQKISMLNSYYFNIIKN